jgi:hypothetical protein
VAASHTSLRVYFIDSKNTCVDIHIVAAYQTNPNDSISAA